MNPPYKEIRDILWVHVRERTGKQIPTFLSLSPGLIHAVALICFGLERKKSDRNLELRKFLCVANGEAFFSISFLDLFSRTLWRMARKVKEKKLATPWSLSIMLAELPQEMSWPTA